MQSAQLFCLLTLSSLLDLQSLEFALFLSGFINYLLIVVVNMRVLTIGAAVQVFVARVEATELIIKIGTVVPMFLSLHFHLLLLFLLDLPI